MKRDLKINFSVLEEIVTEIYRYKSALNEMKRSSSNMVKILKQSQSEAVKALTDLYLTFTAEIKKCETELEDLYSILSRYNSEMQYIIRPVNISAMMRVSRNDIWWNMQSIMGACSGVEMLSTERGSVVLSNISSFVKSDEEKTREERNYRKLETIWNEVIPRYGKQLLADMDALDNVHQRKIIPFENKDDEFNSLANKLEGKYTSFWEGIWRNFREGAEEVWSFIKGVGVGLFDMVKGLLSLVCGVVSYIAAGAVLAVTAPFNAKPKWAEDIFNTTNNTIGKILEDPSLIVEQLSQGVSDAFEEDGAAYCVGYVVGSLVGLKGLDKLGKIAKLKITKVSEVLDTPADEVLTKAGAGGETLGAVADASSINTESFVKFLDKIDAESWGNRVFQSWENGLTSAERQAIYDYTTNAYYPNINNVLRGIESDFASGNAARVEQITNALNKASITDDIVVYRGVGRDALGAFKDLPNNQLVGKVLEDKAFMSTSLVPEGCFSKPITYVIKVPKGTNGAFIENISIYGSDEVELLLNRGQKMVIQQVIEEGSNTKLVMELLP